MAWRLSADFENLTELRHDLDAIEDGLGRALADGITDDAQGLLGEVRRLTPLGPGPRPGANPDSDDALPHIRDLLSVRVLGGTLAVMSEHPGAVVHEFGGTISPHGAPIRFREEAMARRAAVAELPGIERAVEDRIAQLIARHS